jgi:hypothetical protein
MAQTAVDLPDPLGGKTDTGAAFKSADDLLAQLAGDEVDRLLSEADASTPGPLNVDLAVNGDPSEPIELTPVSEAEAQINDGLSSEEAAGINELFKLGSKENDEAAGEAAAPPVAAGAVEKVNTAAADAPAAQTQRATAEAILEKPAEQPPSAAEALAKEMEEDAQAHAAAVARMKQPAASPEPIAAPAKVKGGATEPAAPAAAAPVPAATPATNAEAAAEPETVAEAPTAVIDEDEVDLDAEADEEFQTPLLVRVLEWINAPLSDLSDGAREALGKVALVTTLNAVAVLTYVLLFRRHH